MTKVFDYEKVQSIWLCTYVMKNPIDQSAASVFAYVGFIADGISGVLLFSVYVCNHWPVGVKVEGRFI